MNHFEELKKEALAYSKYALNASFECLDMGDRESSAEWLTRANVFLMAAGVITGPETE